MTPVSSTTSACGIWKVDAGGSRVAQALASLRHGVFPGIVSRITTQELARRGCARGVAATIEHRPVSINTIRRIAPLGCLPAAASSTHALDPPLKKPSFAVVGDE